MKVVEKKIQKQNNLVNKFLIKLQFFLQILNITFIKDVKYFNSKNITHLSNIILINDSIIFFKMADLRILRKL